MGWRKRLQKLSSNGNEPCHEKTCFCHLRTTKAEVLFIYDKLLRLTLTNTQDLKVLMLSKFLVVYNQKDRTSVIGVDFAIQGL